MYNGADNKDFGNVVPVDVATVVHKGIPARSVESIMRAVDKARKKRDPVSTAHFLGKPRLGSAGKPARGPAFTFGEVAVATKAYISVAQVGHHLFLFLPSPSCGHRHHTHMQPTPSLTPPPAHLTRMRPPARPSGSTRS